ncbi:MAG: hypothetical protein UHM85_05765 [Acutalibacteraceae bacterium]|nr:hypothetical protein [Acutalibacteraceae bacterium]
MKQIGEKKENKQYEEEKQKKIKLSEDLKLAISVALVAAVIVLGGNALGIFGSKPEEAPQVEATVSQTAQATQQAAPQTTAPAPSTTAPTTAAPAPSADAQTTAPSPSADTQTTAPSASSEKTTAEILALFNESANRIKGEATKVVKNYEYRTVNTEHLVVPDALQSTAEEMMTKFMGDDLEPIEYATAEEIAAEYMVPGQSYVSKLTEADVKEATCTDNGTEYEIKIVANDYANPTAGVGVGAAFDVIETAEISQKTSMIEKFDSNYYNCFVRCKIDKATGKMTWSNYTVSVIIDCKAKIVKVFDVKCGMTFEKDYTITY